MISFVVMTTVVLVYVLAVTFVTRLVYLQLVKKSYDFVLQSKRDHQKRIEHKGNIYFERNNLEEEAAEVFTLYEMMKNITRSFSEEDALQVFKIKLEENIHFEQCLLLESDSSDLGALKSSEDYFLFTLKGKKEVLGYLAIKGVSLEDKDKLLILSHQFALALQRVRLYQEVERLAITDSLTGIYTRRYILDRVKEEIQRSKLKKSAFSFLMIDVDFFKKFNDRYGHLTGDQILREISRIIMQNIREIDIVGRYGGEEICVLLPETSRDGANYVAERIRSSVEQTAIKAYDAVVNATVSIGIALYPDDGQTMASLIDKADWALYRAKKMGRNSICCFGIYE